MATVDAPSEFDQVQSTVTSESSSVLDALKDIADEAKRLVIGNYTDNSTVAQLSFIENSSLRSETGSTQISLPDAPSEPSDQSLFTEALDYLAWLQEQALYGATFPTYSELFPDEPPSSVEVDTSNPNTFSINDVPVPTYTVPVWDDSSAWSGGDLSLDGTIGPLTAPFVWSGGDYTSPLVDNGSNLIYQSVITDLQSSNYGIDDLDEGLVWDRARERETRAMTAAIDTATRLFAAGGFTAPTGALQGMIDRVSSEARDKISSASREIMIQKSALFLEAKKIAQANGLEIEKESMSFFNATADMLLRRLTQEIASTIAVSTFNVERIKMHIEKYRSFAEAFRAQVDGSKGIVDMYAAEISAEKTKADANSAMYEAIISKNKAVIDQYVASLQGFQTVMDARVKYHGVLADVYKTQVTNINAHVDATRGAYELADKQQKNIVDFRVGKYNAEISSYKTKIDEIIAFVQARVDQLKAQSQAYTAIAVGAMSGLNTNLSLSLGAQTGIQGSESHSYDETKDQDSGKQYSYVHSWDETKSTDSGDQTSYNYNYNRSGSI